MICANDITIGAVMVPQVAEGSRSVNGPSPRLLFLAHATDEIPIYD